MKEENKMWKEKRGRAKLIVLTSLESEAGTLEVQGQAGQLSETL